MLYHGLERLRLPECRCRQGCERGNFSMGNVLAKVPDARTIVSPLYNCRGVLQANGTHLVGTHQLSRVMTPSNDSGVAYRMDGTHADIPSSSSIPVTPIPRTPKHNSQRSMSTVHHLDPEQGSLGSQGSVDLPVDCGQARLLELGKSPECRRRPFQAMRGPTGVKCLPHAEILWHPPFLWFRTYPVLR